jgi:hypothetical protein
MSSDLIVYLISYMLPVLVVLMIGAPEIQIRPSFKILGSPAAGRAGRVFLELSAMNMAILIFYTWALVAPPVWVVMIAELAYALFSRYMGPYLE